MQSYLLGLNMRKEEKMSHYIEVRGVKIGEGIPKICVPIVGKTQKEILTSAQAVKEAQPDVVEWRVDWFENVENIRSIIETLEKLRMTLGEIPLLFTARTMPEGGEWDANYTDYTVLNERVAQTKLVDLIDVELFTADKNTSEIIQIAHRAGVKVVTSSHDFEETPDKNELISRMCQMQELGADIPKIAVMPQNAADVLTLLTATQEMSEKYAKGPIITMSMAGQGFISRACGEVFGSALTFGAVGQASAPGQMQAGDLRTLLELIHRGL
jgi:3-dehydroquinate dehydratase-1